MPVFRVVVHTHAAGLLEPLDVLRVEIQQVRLLVVLALPPFRQISDTRDIRWDDGIVEVEQILIADRVGDLPGAVGILRGILKDVPVAFDEAVIWEALLDISFDQALPQHEITCFGRVDAPPLHRTVLHNRQPIQQDFRLCYRRSARAGPMRLGVGDAGE